MATWTRMRVCYTVTDLKAFDDLEVVASHFGLPFTLPSRIFSRFLDERGCVPKADVAKRRSGAFGHYFAYRLFAAEHPEVWIWNERYWFFGGLRGDTHMTKAQLAFREKLGETRLTRLCRAATARGMSQTCKTGPGLPDLAVYVPGATPEWRFVEVKIPERGDELTHLQMQWLDLLAEVFGTDSAIELELIPEKVQRR